ncbi:hypothetical protein CHS0354_007452 [Potamilus streckersoni]|uniref:Lysosome-associated membrane glycoprotein 5 n=1 Tax=Potamilus streckersoni TaxID=2493646 RepID=A0AAE0SW43_9BIVA|nr:hypothetical protein CHS0354_007452 [Potamilus streckersoni]
MGLFGLGAFFIAISVIHGYDNEEPTTVLQDQDGHYCLIASMGLDVEIEYIAFDENTTRTLPKKNLRVPDHASVRGNCSYSRTELTFSWDDGKYQLLMVFDSQVVNDSRTWSLTELGLTMDVNTNITHTSSIAKRVELGKGDVRMFETPYNNSYECQSKQKIRLKSTNSYTNVIFSHMRLQPFSAMDKFKGGITCKEDKDKGISLGSREEVFVPLIVAICLAVVVLLVILGYLIRKKFEGFGYANMD